MPTHRPSSRLPTPLCKDSRWNSQSHFRNPYQSRLQGRDLGARGAGRLPRIPPGLGDATHRALVATFAASAVCPEPAPNTPRLTVSCTMGSELETAMETLINVFHAHSGKEGDKYKLSKKELKELLQTELSGFLDAQKDADAVDKVMKELDENGDGEVDFQEYVVLVAALTVACNNFFWENRAQE
uniref:Protein S100-A1 n=2 Tax=Boreoeutheria TaxID=1437010 RepID=A0A4X1W0L4_PIG